MRFGTETYTLSELAKQWKGIPKLRVWEVLRYGGRVTGRKPTGMKAFARLVAAGPGTAVEATWGQHSSFPPPV
jgi:hypothetical protein